VFSSNGREPVVERLVAWILVGLSLVGCGGASSPDRLLADTESGEALPAENSVAADEPGKYPALHVLGPTAAPALAPVRLAALGIYPGSMTVAEGGVAELCSGTTQAQLAVDSELRLLRVSTEERCSDLRALFTVSERYHRIVAKRSSGIESLSDLAGKRVLVERGSPSHRFLAAMAARANLELGDGPGQVHVVEGRAGEGFASQAAPDAVALVAPEARESAASLGGDAVSLELGPDGVRVYRELLNLHSTARLLEDIDMHRAIARFTKALSEASSPLERDQAAAIPLLAGPGGSNTALVEKSLQHQRFPGILVGDVQVVLEESEDFDASLEGRKPRTHLELSKLVDWSVYLTALWPLSSWE